MLGRQSPIHLARPWSPVYAVRIRSRRIVNATIITIPAAASRRDPVSLNDEFEEKYDTVEYEAKMSRLLHRAYKRSKAENPGVRRPWDEAISALEKATVTLCC